MNRRPCIALLATAALLAGCADSSTSPSVEQAAHSLLGGLDAGESFTLAGDDAATLYLNGGPGGSEYIVIPFHRSPSADVTLQLEMSGEGAEAGGGSAAVVPELADAPATFDGRRMSDRSRAHVRLRSRMTRQTNELLRAAGHPLRDGLDARRDRAPGPQAAPQTGDLLELNVQANLPCDDAVYRTGRVAAVTDRAVVIADTSNPAGGFDDAEYRALGEEFDQLVHPIGVETFGEPTDIDENERVLIFFTSAVNELTEPGSGRYVGGFFYARDLFPTSDPNPDAACEGSNEAEMVYLMVPDPQRAEANEEPVFGKDFVAENATAIIGHEFQHLINASRRIYVNGAEEFEEVWLGEGLSHMAEELLYYEAVGLGPGRNITLETLAASQERVDQANRFIVANLVRYARYLEAPVTSSLFGAGSLETRGAVWAFLRYAADHDDRSDRAFLHDLANSTQAGFDNLDAVLGGEALERTRDWVVSVYADDAIGSMPDRYTQPSWNFRSVLTGIFPQFPLDIRWLEAGRVENLALQGGGGAFLELQAGPAKRPSVRTSRTGSGALDGLEITVIRTR